MGGSDLVKRAAKLARRRGGNEILPPMEKAAAFHSARVPVLILS
jgi:hypothetical protein